MSSQVKFNLIYFMTCICFRYDEEEEVLCVTDWGKKLSFYNKNGSEVIYLLLYNLLWV